MGLASQRKPVHGEDFRRSPTHTCTRFSFLVTGLDGFRVLTRCAPRNPVASGSRPLAHFDARGWRICGGVARACMGAWHHMHVLLLCLHPCRPRACACVLVLASLSLPATSTASGRTCGSMLAISWCSKHRPPRWTRGTADIIRALGVLVIY